MPPQTLNAFGSRTWNLDALVAGKPALPELQQACAYLVNFLGMDTAGMPPDIRTYPIPDGRGGEGQTVYQPFVEPKLLHQPLTTSFIIFDLWPEHFTVTVKSCIQFSAEAVCTEISRLLGPVLDCHSWQLAPVARGRQGLCGGLV